MTDQHADVQFDWQRADRTGVSEAVLCLNKTADQIARIVADADSRGVSLLLTRLQPEMAQQVQECNAIRLDYDPVSNTAVVDNGLIKPVASDCLIVTAGSSDMSVAIEAQTTLRFHGLEVAVLADCGVAGLWRLTDQIDRLRRAPVIIAVAGMEGALFPVLGGMVPGVVIAVPGSTGYGVAQGGHTALNTALATCAPGVVTVNIDNGFGAACAMIKMLGVGSPAARQASAAAAGPATSG